jgi:ATP-binding cassette, subfamily B, bacterial
MAVALVCAVPFMFLLLKLYSRIADITVRSNKVRDENNRRIVERLHQARLVKTLGTEDEEITELARQYDVWSGLLFQRSIFESLGRAILPALPFFAALVLAALAFISPAILRDILLVLGPMAFIAFRLLGAVDLINGRLIEIRINQDAVRLILDEFGGEAVSAGGTPGRPVDRLRDIEFQNVSFSYGRQEAALKDVAIRLDREHPIYLRGASGSGKSTLAHLLRGVVEPTSGRVLFNGIDLRELDRNTLKRQIGYMTQEAYLFHGTVRENLLYGHVQEKVDDSALWTALEVSALKNFVASLPGGLDYVLTERGSVFSGGEKQRLSLARIVLKNPSLLILDEVTNNLDPETRRIILDTINQLSQTRLCFIISHDEEAPSGLFQLYEMRDGQMLKLQPATTGGTA